MSRNTLLVAAIVVALVLGGVLWFTLSPERTEELADARPVSQTGATTDAGKKPSSEGGTQGGQPSQGGASDTDGSSGLRTAELEAEGETETAAADEPVAAEPQVAAAAPAPAPTVPAAAAPADTAGAGPSAPAIAPPSFDIVRVEKDGNAVIAGRAEPGATVHLLDGDKLIAEGQAGSDGSFALLLDEPLSEGTRRLSLAVKTEDGTLVPSEDEVVVVVQGTASTAPSATPSTTDTASASAAAAQQSAEAAVAAVEAATEAPEETAAAETAEAAESTAAPGAAAEETAESTTAAEPAAAAPAPASAPAPEAQPAATESASVTESAATAEPATTTGEQQTTETEVADTPKLAEQLAAEQDVASASTSAESASQAAAASDEPLVVIQPKSGQGASQILQGAAGGAKPAVAIEAVDYDLKGQVVISGSGPAGAQVLLYLDHAVLGQATVGEDGRWQFTPEQNVAPGLHRLRADLVGADGSVVARAEIPFQRAEPIQVAADEEFIVVQPGHSLWVIARKRWGEGLQYTTLYEANATQIRNPDLIYPGQIFLVPSVN